MRKSVPLHTTCAIVNTELMSQSWHLHGSVEVARVTKVTQSVHRLQSLTNKSRIIRD